MRRAVLVWVFSILAALVPRGPLVAAEGEAPAGEAVKAAVTKALPLLWKGAEGHVAHRTCFACHNQVLPILAFTTARPRGFPCPEADLKKQLDFIAAFLDGNREAYRQGKGQGGQVDTAGYALLALELGGWKPDATTEAVAEYLLLRDKDLDHWRTTSKRPPSEVSDFTPTYLAIRALDHWATPAQKERVAKRLATVRPWLLTARATDCEDRVFRLLALRAAGADDKDVRLAATELAKTQRPDGGWAQTDAMESDAYATGSALVALHEAGGLAAAEPAYQRGLAFLLKAQREDGSWLVHSRSDPFQTYFESGFPHGKDQFISMAASGWAATALALALPLAPPADETPRHQIVASGKAAGGYAAFPDVCRTKAGDLFCVFYSGYGHVSKPSKDWPRGGRVMATRSTDQGKSWTAPFVLADTDLDDRDPHVAALRDGTLLCTWFTLRDTDKPGEKPLAVLLARSTDDGKTWSQPAEVKIDSATAFASSAPVRELPDGSLILGLYAEDGKTGRAFGATIKSYDGGKSWKDLAPIGENSGLYLDAETDVVRLTDGTLLAALRSSKTDLYFATSADGGKSWSKVRSSGFKGHCPHFLRHSSGAILLTHRLPATAVHWSVDEGKTWQGPLQIDRVGGAYPSSVELPDGTVFCVYYEEGEGSSIRGMRLKVTRAGVTRDVDK